MVCISPSKKRAKDGVTNVYTSVTVNKKRVRFALKHYVKVESRDTGRGGLKVKVPGAKETNAYLEQVKFTITTYYQQLQIAGEEVTPQLLISMFLGKETEETYSLSKLMDYHREVASVLLKKISDDMYVLREKLEPSTPKWKAACKGNSIDYLKKVSK